MHVFFQGRDDIPLFVKEGPYCLHFMLSSLHSTVINCPPTVVLWRIMMYYAGCCCCNVAVIIFLLLVPLVPTVFDMKISLSFTVSSTIGRDISIFIMSGSSILV